MKRSDSLFLSAKKNVLKKTDAIPSWNQDHSGGRGRRGWKTGIQCSPEAKGKELALPNRSWLPLGPHRKGTNSLWEGKD